MRLQIFLVSLFIYFLLLGGTVFGFLEATKIFQLTFEFDLYPPPITSDKILSIGEFSNTLSPNRSSSTDGTSPLCERRKENSFSCSIRLNRPHEVEELRRQWLKELPRNWNFVPRELLTLRLQELEENLSRKRGENADLREALSSLYEESESRLKEIDFLSGELERAIREERNRRQQGIVISQSLPKQNPGQRPIFRRKLAEVNAQVEDLQGRIKNIRLSQEKLETEVAPYLRQKRLEKESSASLEKESWRLGQLSSFLSEASTEVWLRDPEKFVIHEVSQIGPTREIRKWSTLPWITLVSTLLFGFFLRFIPSPKKIDRLEDLRRATSFPVLGELILLSKDQS